MKPSLSLDSRPGTERADTERADTERADTERADTERADTERADGERVGLDCLHHVAVHVDCIEESVAWYRDHFRCEISYQDSTWALLRFDNTHLALVSRGQHPPHVAFSLEHADRFGPLTPHRDGSRSIYVSDPSGNAIEVVDSTSLQETR